MSFLLGSGTFPFTYLPFSIVIPPKLLILGIVLLPLWNLRRNVYSLFSTFFLINKPGQRQRFSRNNHITSFINDLILKIDCP